MSTTETKHRADRNLFQISTAAHRLDSSKSHIKRLIASGVLERVGAGRFVRVTGESIDRYIKGLTRA